MNQDSASLTRSNACAVWISTPSRIAPEKYPGEAISSKERGELTKKQLEYPDNVATQDDALEIVIEGSEPHERSAALVRFAAMERDALCLLPKIKEARAEIRLHRLLSVVKAD